MDPVRDYMSLAKRYPRLSISPEFSKVCLLTCIWACVCSIMCTFDNSNFKLLFVQVVINWPKEILNISLYLPVR